MASLKNVVLFQSTAWLFVAFVFFLFSGSNAACSAFVGGAVCALPSFFVIALMMLNKSASPFGIFIYEFIKVSMIILGFLLVALLYKDLNWLAFIISSATVLLSHVFALSIRR